MNLIRCNQECVHQREGFCSLQTGLKVYNSVKNGCVYLQERKKPEKPKKQDEKENLF